MNEYELKHWVHIEEMKGELITDWVEASIQYWQEGLITTGELLNKLGCAHRYWYVYSSYKKGE